jgi:hypothetical protein
MSEQFNPAGNGKKTITLPQAPQAQPARVEAEQKQRRRRSDTSETRNMKLAVPKNLLDPKFEYRWINDTSSGRIQSKTEADDWDVVHKLDSANKEVPVVRNVGTGENGQPLKAFLCRKPKEFCEEDRVRKQSAISAQEEDLRRGGKATLKGQDAPTAYVPGGSNTIERQH